MGKHKNIDVCIGILFHKEGNLARPAMLALIRMLEHLEKFGKTAEVIINLDNCDETTGRIISELSRNDFQILQTNFGDPSLARNFIVRNAIGDYVTLLDGDDLWSENWVTQSLLMAKNETTNKTILHPEFLYLFSESDFEIHSASTQPNPRVISHFLMHESTVHKNNAELWLKLDNLWSANSFAARQIFLDFPFIENEMSTGTGIEDWSFNFETTHHGISHQVVQGTLHMIRMKDSGSQNKTNFLNSLLPNFSKLESGERHG